MRRLVKSKELKVRLSPQDATELERAARAESRRRGELVGESTLLRELAMPHIRKIVAAEQAAA